MKATEKETLEGKIVFIRSRGDRHNPMTGMRGTIHVIETENADEYPHVELVLQYPNMFLAPSHLRVILLNAEEVERLIASERNGVYEFTIEGDLNP